MHLPGQRDAPPDSLHFPAAHARVKSASAAEMRQVAE